MSLSDINAQIIAQLDAANDEVIKAINQGIDEYGKSTDKTIEAPLIEKL